MTCTFIGYRETPEHLVQRIGVFTENDNSPLSARLLIESWCLRNDYIKYSGLSKTDNQITGCGYYEAEVRKR